MFSIKFACFRTERNGTESLFLRISLCTFYLDHVNFVWRLHIAYGFHYYFIVLLFFFLSTISLIIRMFFVFFALLVFGFSLGYRFSDYKFDKKFCSSTGINVNVWPKKGLFFHSSINTTYLRGPVPKILSHVNKYIFDFCSHSNMLEIELSSNMERHTRNIQKKGEMLGGEVDSK